MGQLPDELARMLATFNKLCDDVEAGHIPYDEGLETASNLVAIDGAGARWTVNTAPTNASDQFMRGWPGQDPVVADTREFVPGGQPSVPAPAFVEMAPRQSVFGPGDSSAGFAPSERTITGPAPVAVDDFNTPPGGFDNGGRAARRAARASQSKKPAKVKSGPSVLVRAVDSVRYINWGGLLQGRGRTILIVLVCLGLLVGAAHFLGRSGNSKGSIPQKPAAAGPGKMPVDGKAAGTAPPNGDQVKSLISAVTSGNRDVARNAVAHPGDPVRIAMATGELLGYTKTGLQVSAGTPALDGGNAIADVRLINAVDQKTFATTKVTMVVQDGKWLLSDWPNFARR